MYNIVNHRKSKTNASIISIIQRVADISSIFIAGYFVSIYFKINFYYQPLIYGFLLLSVFQMVGGVTDFYRSWRGVKFITELKITAQNWAVTAGISACICLLITNFSFKLDFFVMWFLSFLLLVYLMRLSIRLLAGYFRSLGYNTRTVAIVGDMHAGKELIKVFNEQKWLGFEVYGYYSEIEKGNSHKGDFDQLVHDAKSGKIDRIYLALNFIDTEKLDILIRRLADTTCSVMLVPDIFAYDILHCRIEEINGVPIIPLFETPLNGLNKVIKRIEDFILSLIILIIISPLLIIIAMAVKITSPGPIIFKQTRYGIDGKAIKIWKFRSMQVLEDHGKIDQAKKNDPRVTRVGGFLRRSSLDELPQFFNVLFGSMSIVGPRPHAVAHNEQYRMLINGYMLRHKVKPGITGWAQINGWRGETDTLEKMEKRVEFDLEYIRNWSLLFDLKIVFLTIFKGFFGKNAY